MDFRHENERDFFAVKLESFALLQLDSITRAIEAFIVIFMSLMEGNC